MGIEYELKYRATEEKLAAIRAAFPGNGQTLHMETTYYDTPSGELSARRHTLRQRLENGVSVCTLKAPAGERGRGEWEIRRETIGEALPELARISGIPMPNAESLIPVCGARFTRITVLLIQPYLTAELALDKGVLMGGGRQIPLCEVELELKSGEKEVLDAFGKQFQLLFGLKKESKSKFRRALALREEEAHV